MDNANRSACAWPRLERLPIAGRSRMASKIDDIRIHTGKVNAHSIVKHNSSNIRSSISVLCCSEVGTKRYGVYHPPSYRTTVLDKNYHDKRKLRLVVKVHCS